MVRLSWFDDVLHSHLDLDLQNQKGVHSIGHIEARCRRHTDSEGSERYTTSSCCFIRECVSSHVEKQLRDTFYLMKISP